MELAIGTCALPLTEPSAMAPWLTGMVVPGDWPAAMTVMGTHVMASVGDGAHFGRGARTNQAGLDCRRNTRHRSAHRLCFE